MADVAVIGAGLSGLVCAQQLQRAGYQVVVIEKSRGLGGRLATRRLQDTCADHGVRYLNQQGQLSQSLIQTLKSQGIIQPWIKQILKVQSIELGQAQIEADLAPVETYYTAAAGLTAVAKFLAADLNILRGQRVQALQVLPDQTWQLTLEASGVEPLPPLTAPSIVLAIPAPQALSLLQPSQELGLPDEFIPALQSVSFDPCLTAIATYAPEKLPELASLPWQAATFSNSADLAWVSLEHTKRLEAPFPVALVQSTAKFAETYLESADLKPAGQLLLDQAAALVPWLNRPTELQVHRWRYALVRHSLSQPCLSTHLPLPLVCSGDWCGGQQIENALESGLAAAYQISQLLERNLLPSLGATSFQELIQQLAIPRP